MTGLFGMLNTSSGGMRAQQIALQTTSHNLTNMNTPDYSRQRVTMSTAFSQSMAGIGQLGTGVQISGVIRVSDEYIMGQLQNELSSLTQHENISEVMGQLEAIFNEPSKSGISQQISDFFVSWGNLGSSSEIKTSKTMVVKQTETLIDTVNHLANQIDSLGKDTVKQIEQEIKDFNAVAEQLKSLNDQIFNATVKGEHPNDLYDSQDRLVGQLKDIAGVNVEKRDKYGRIMVSLNGPKDVDGNLPKVDIVTANGVEKLSADIAADDIVNIRFTVGDPEVEVELNKGSIKGFHEAAKEVVNKGKELDNFIGKFATAVNFIATDAGNQPDNAIFDIESIKSAKDIKVNQKLIDNPEKLIVGKDFDSPVAGDGSRAKAISDLQHVALNFSSTETISKFEESLKFNQDSLTIENQEGGASIFNHYNDIITDMGIIKQQADNMVTNQSDLVALLEQRHESISGVDLNEEIVDMIRFNSAYQANARVISTINEMLDTLINRMGV